MEICNPNDAAKLTIPRSVCGRVDLLQALALAKGDTGREIALAEILGFAPLADEIADKVSVTGYMEAKESALVTTEKRQQHVKFRPYHLVAVDTEVSEHEWQTTVPNTSESGTLTADDMMCWDANVPVAQSKPIVPWARLWPRLRKAVAHTRASTLDIPCLTEQLSRGVAVRRLPRKLRLTWPNQWSVVLDYSDRLTPYWDDWHWLRQQLQTRFNRQVRFYRLHGVPQQQLQPMMDGRPEGQFMNWPRLGPGDTLLLASDLGMVDPAHPWPAACWQSKLAGYQRCGVRVIVLAPISARHLQPSLVNLADVLRLSPDSSLRPLRRISPVCASPIQPQPKLSPAGATLLTMMSVATRVEPALLRELRGCLPDASRDSGLEGEVWCYPELDTAATACALGSWAVQNWREKFADLPEQLQKNTLECLRRWHARLPQAIHHEETLLWQYLANTQTNRNEEQNVARARQFYIKIKNTLLSDDATGLQQGSRALQTQLADRHVQWVAPTLGNTESYIAELSSAVAQVEPKRIKAGLPAGVDPVAWLKTLPVIATERVFLLQQPDLNLSMQQDLSQKPASTGCTLLANIDTDRSAVVWALTPDGDKPSYRSWFWQGEGPEQAPVLPGILTANAETEPQDSLYILTVQQRFRFEIFTPPDWATAWGQDQYGLYADFTLDNISQRFRWIAPGTFLMGSPETEIDGYEDENQHRVTLSQGFWLADSACNQELWTTVMGDNPSKFQDNDNNPVETVSWDDVKQFINKLNSTHSDLQARLPTEAEWEYACRAGTDTPFSFGENITPEQVNYNGEYPYAGGEKGLHLKQTVPVKSLPPNPWGLYEMHGNVWEWCQDWFGKYSEQAVTDPVESKEGDDRVLRGGSWDFNGRYARSASRFMFGPDLRFVNFGFRLALGRAGVSGLSKQQKLQAAAGRTAEAEAGSQTGRSTPSGKQPRET